MRLGLILALVFSSWLCFGQFSPRHNVVGSNAIRADSNIIIGWANSCITNRGPQDLSNLSLGLVTAGSDTSIPGRQGGMVSLGDKGVAVLSFSPAIANGLGPDFVVFENGFESPFGDYLELAFVEVSNDGTNWYRFPATSLTPVNQQIGAFGTLNDVTLINNLAGKYIGSYGVPFDLDELVQLYPAAGLQSVNYVRIIDVCGSIQPMIGSVDKDGRPINDPFPTPFPSSGFDLTGVGVIHHVGSTGLKNGIESTGAHFIQTDAGEWIWLGSAGARPIELRFVNLLGQVEVLNFGMECRFKLKGTGYLVWHEMPQRQLKKQLISNF